MSKKVQKTLTGAMAAMMATGVVATPAMAATNTNVDALYKAAYQATQKALTEKTQASINEARKAIKALPANLDWAIGEFSKQVDTVQQPIFSNIVKLIKKAEKEPTQANINAARKAIPAELAPVWRNSYSSAVDKVQQGLQQKAVDAVKKAETDKTQENVDAAKVLVNDLLTADSQGIKDWAKTLLNRVEAIKIYDLDVTKITEINRYNVTVEFEGLTENLKSATIEVIDNNGDVHEVSAKNLLKGAKKATFEFKNVLGATALKGVWTVNGVEFDFTEAGLVKEVRTSTGDLAKLESALVELQEKGYITGLLGDYNSKKEFVFDTVEDAKVSVKYKTALTGKTLNNAADVQAIIDKVNSDLEGNISVDNLILLAKKEEGKVNATDKQVYNAMVELGLEKVNYDWIAGYRDAIAAKDKGTKIETIQDLVYSSNNKTIDETKYVIPATDNKTEIKNTRTAIEDKITLVEDYYKDDADKVTAKADLLKSLRVDIALLDVKSVTDPTDLGAALMNLSDVVNDKDKFNYSTDINETIMENYLASITKAVSVADLKTKAQDVQKVVLADKMKDIINDENDKDALLKALKAEEIGLKNVSDANKDEYFADKAKFGDATVDTVQGIVNSVNARVSMKKATTVDTMFTALNSYISINDKALFDKSEAVRKDYAQEILAAKNDGAKLDTISSVNTIIGSVESTIADKLGAVNIIKVDANGAITYDRPELVKALKAVTGKSEVELDSLISKFIEKSSVKDSTGKVTGIVTYTTYTQVKDALK
ncbi:hypothetical protein [Clostridium sp. D46t1_190503_E9]|uniref:hypothetical protein n=1 Tax=Clostridium sp. D46t1_190503_E9 TaxID=2787137 RepID=UPI0018993D72|nr:hypothetical protein [Clostridium sp. D46t1_190503_E9]